MPRKRVPVAPSGGRAARRVRDPARSRPLSTAPPSDPTPDRGAQVEAMAAEVLRLLRVDPRAALATADRMAQIATGDPRLEARSRWSRAHALSNLSQYRAASEHFGGAEFFQIIMLAVFASNRGY